MEVSDKVHTESGLHTIHNFAILELEFYLYKTGCHEDPFTHGTEEQRLSGRWYVFLSFSMSTSRPTFHPSRF